MAIELAAGYVSASVKFDGATKGIGKLFDSAQKQATGAGKKTGEAYTKALEAELKTAEAQVKKLSETVVKARDKEADAAGKLRVATEKLNEARSKGVTGSRLTRLEEQRESLLRRQTAAAKDLARETDGLARAEERRSRVQSKLDEPSKGGFLSRFKLAGRDSGKAFNDAAAREVGRNKIADAGAAAGAKVKGGFLRGIGRPAAMAASIIGIGAVINKGFGRLVAIDNAQAQMRSLGYDAQGVEDIMQSALESVKGTAYGLGEAASLAGGALASGVKPGQDLTKYLSMVADTAAFAQQPLGEMGEVLGKVMRAGKLTGDTMDSLSTRGVPLAEWIKEEFGEGADISSQQVFDLLEKRLKGSAKSMGDTFQGALMNLGAATGRLGEKLLKPLFDLGKTGFGALTGVFDNLTTVVEPAVENISQKVGAFVSGTLVPLFQRAWPVIRNVFDSLRGGASSVFPMLIGKAQELASRFIPPLQNLVISVVGAVQDAMPTIRTLAMGAAAGVAGAFEVFKTVGPIVVSVVSGVVRWFGRLSPLLIPIAAGFAAFKVFSLTVAGIVVVTKAWAAAQAILNAVMAANPVGLVIAAVAALVAGLVLAYQKSETFRNIVNGAWAAIKAVVGGAWNFLKTAVFAPMAGVFKAAGAVVTGLWKGAVVPAFGGIRAVAGFMWEVVSDIFNNWKRAFQLAATVAKALWHAGVKPAFDWIKGGISAAWDFVSPVFEKFKSGWDTLRSGFVSGANAIKDGVTAAFSGLAGIIKAPLRALGSFLSGIPTSIMGFDIPGADSVRSWGEKLQGLRRGGVVRGPGTGTSDSVLAWLSNGEGVVTARAMANGGAGVVEALNQGWVPSAAYLRDMYNLPGYAKGLGPGASYLKSLVMKLWPSITTVGGVRGEDGYGEHSSGNALDIMIPDYQTPQGQAMGDSIAAFIRKNASALQLDGLIWKQQSFGYGGSFSTGKQMPDRGSDTQNHMDHLHVMLGKGRGAGAAPVSMPSVKLSAPSGMGGGSIGGGSRGKGMTESQRAQKAADKQTRIDQLNAELAAAEQALAEAEANSKTKESTLMSKRNAVQKKKDAIAKAERELEEIENSPLADDLDSTSGASTSDNPFAKIIDGFAQLGQAGFDGAVEGLLPPGFSNPMEWGVLKAGGGLLKWIGGLTRDPVANAVLGTIGSGMTGDVQGAGSALAGLFNPQEMLAEVAGDDMGGAFTDGMIDPQMAMAGGGATVDNSVTVNNAPYQDSTQKVMDAAAGRQMAGQRRYMGTKRIV